MKRFVPKSFSDRVSLEIFVVSLCCLLILTAFHLRYSYQKATETAKTRLLNKVDYLSADFISRIESLQQDVAFLSSVPPIQGIIRASRGEGQDLKDNSTIQQWKDRLAVIFKEILIANPQYLQVRFVGVADHGREIVRVEWHDRRLERTPDNLLQAKADEDYFKHIVGFPLRKVYLGDFSLNREWGRLVIPPQLVLRAGMPVADSNNKVSGFVIINMLAEDALAALLDLHKFDEHVDIYNSELKPLVTSSQSQGWIQFAKGGEESTEIQKAFQEVLPESPTYQSEFADQLLILKKIFYAPLNPRRFLGIALTAPKTEVYQEVWKEFNAQIWIIALISSLFMALIILSLRRQTQPLKLLRSMADDLAKGRQLPEPRGLKEKDDELTSLTLSFYDMADQIYQKTTMLNLQKDALDESALVSETDARGRITYANKKFAEITGYSVEELLGSDHRIINSGHHPKDFFKDLWRTISQGNSWRGEVKNKRKDGSYYWVDSSIVPFKGVDGKIHRYVSIRFDITEKKEQEKKLEELTHAKSKFLAVMSHEIRTPLGAVIGLSQLLESTPLNQEQQTYVDNIAQSAHALLAILNDILDLSKLDAGKINLHLEVASPKELGEGVIGIFREKAIEKNIELHLSANDDLPPGVMIDSVRWKQVLINLVSNAIKFTAQGEIRIDMSYDSSRSILVASVKDTGIGMSPDQLDKVFNEFEQAESSTSRNYGGTGLGLPICKKIIAAMGGSLDVSSEVGRGTVFTIQVPAKSSTKNIQTKTSGNSSISNLDKTTKILLAEDFHLNQVIFNKMFGDHGIAVVMVDNGLKAVHELEKNDYDMVFLDIQMPVMDGVEACLRIRKLKKTKPIWLIALTANTFRDDIDKYQEAGFDDYIAKPFTKKALSRAVNGYLKKHGLFTKGAEAKLPAVIAPTVQSINTEILDELIQNEIGADEKFWDKVEKSLQDAQVKLGEARDQEDLEALAATAHTTRGVCLSVGMTNSVDLLQRLESGAKNHNLEDCKSLIPPINQQLDQEFHQVKGYVMSRAA